MRLRLLLCVSPFLIFSALSAHAQIAAAIRGQVLDASGAGVANATVVLTQSATESRVSTTTSATGDYSFTHLTPGAYQSRRHGIRLCSSHSHRGHCACGSDCHC